MQVHLSICFASLLWLAMARADRANVLAKRAISAFRESVSLSALCDSSAIPEAIRFGCAERVSSDRSGLGPLPAPRDPIPVGE